jgi:ketosteroid isomerase-like protein
MSQENVEVVRRGWAAWERGDMATALADHSEDIIVTRAAPLPDVVAYHGRDGMMQMLADWVEQFDEFQMTGAEFKDANDSQVVVRVHQQARGKHSGAPIEADFWFAYTPREGQSVRWDIYASEAQALKAVGLAE